MSSHAKKLKAQPLLLPALLNQTLATTLDLKLQAKQAHWNVKGENFIALHELFDRVATEVEAFSDLQAERAVQLGATAGGLTSDIQKLSILPSFPTGSQDGAKYVKALTGALRKTADQARHGIDLATEQGDAVTADMYTQVASGLDKLRWFVEAHQK
jgi:starvation-inducible DNA-binding protein